MMRAGMTGLLLTALMGCATGRAVTPPPAEPSGPAALATPPQRAPVLLRRLAGSWSYRQEFTADSAGFHCWSTGGRLEFTGDGPRPGTMRDGPGFCGYPGGSSRTSGNVVTIDSVRMAADRVMIYKGMEVLTGRLSGDTLSGTVTGRSGFAHPPDWKRVWSPLRGSWTAVRLRADSSDQPAAPKRRGNR